MAKRIQLVLNQNIYKLGGLGDLVEVAPGYARNYLLPQGLAYLATPGVLKQAERRKEEERKRQLELKQAAEKVKQALEKVAAYTVTMPVGENDVLFGSVTAQDVADVILATAKQTVDRRDITIPEIRKLGTFKAEVKLHQDVVAALQVVVEPQ
jgi:large subunit ribosomal protein L9